MNLIHLQFFCDAVMLNSISEAAKKNFVTQSTISQGISKLEKTLGVSLVTHSRQRFQITEEGQIVFEQAKHVFQSIREMQDEINAQRGQVNGSLHFACTNSLGMSFIDNAFMQMQSINPQVSMKISPGGLYHIRTSLQQGFVEMAVVLSDSTFSQFSKVPLYKGQFRLYQSSKAEKNSIENGVLVDNVDGTFVSQLLDQGLKVHSELGGWEVVARFTDQDIGVGFFPDYIMLNNRYPALLPCKAKIPAFEYEISAIYPKGHKLSRGASAFIELLKRDGE